MHILEGAVQQVREEMSADQRLNTTDIQYIQMLLSAVEAAPFEDDGRAAIEANVLLQLAQARMRGHHA